MLPVLRTLEDHFLGNSEHHGTGGEWRVERAAAVLGRSSMRSARPRRKWASRDDSDFNTGDNEGVSYFHVNQKRGRRWSSARAFLKPALDRPNLRLRDRRAGRTASCSRTAAPSASASGRTAQLIEARAKGEVILSAGAIGSPQVLHRSGIGPAEWLSPPASTIVLDQPGVGRNLQDHLQQRAIFKVSGRARP